MKCPNLHCLQSLSGDPEACPNCGLPLPGAVLGERFRLERVESASATAVRFGGHEGTSAVRVRVYLAGGGKGQRVGVISREVAEVRDLGSGGMPRVLGAAVAGPLPWVATDGGDHLALDREMLRQQRPYSEKEVVAVLEGVARTLAPLHAKGIAHRGIRPDQLFRRDGDAHVGLGLPNWGADLEDRPPDALKSPYLAPEYATGRASPRSDMYALGVTAIHLLTGLQGSELARAARDPGGRKDRFGLTAGCFDILTALLAEETIKRVASAGQLLDLLGRANLEAHGGASGGAAAGAAAPPHPEGGGLLDDVERHLRAAGLSGVGAERFAARLRKHRGEQAGGTDKRKVALLAGLLALLALAATRARGLARAIAEPALRAKILFAMGLGVTAVAGGGVVLARLGGQPERRQEIVHALPTPVTGANADAVAAAQAGHKDLLARAGATPDYEVVRELPAGPEPAADPGRPAGQAASPPPDLQPDRPPGQPPGQSPGQTPAGPPGKEPARPASAGPYDEVAEPGTDPEDASGLKKKSEFFIRVNKTYKTLTLYHNGQYATQYVVAIGARANTPDGRYSIKKKIANPSYENVPAGDARNPLGTRWLGMDVRYPGGRSIGIHGTNNESSIGQAASGGCIRMKNSEVEQLFDLVPEGTPVEIN